MDRFRFVCLCCVAALICWAREEAAAGEGDEADIVEGNGGPVGSINACWEWRETRVA